ncbi:MAG: FHA domain-containing protein [Chloroflexota bacterium]
MAQFGKLICLSGSNTGQEYALSEEITTIGRDAESTITLQDSSVSRHHAEIRRIDNAYQVHDLKSKNGVLVSGRRLAPGSTEWLEDGCDIFFGTSRFRFQDPSATMTAPSLMAVNENGLRVDLSTREVYVDGQRLDPPLSVKQFDLLYFLYQNHGTVVSKDDIARAVWPEAAGDVFDANIDRMISRVRSRIEPHDNDEPRFIVTTRGYGYKLTL